MTFAFKTFWIDKQSILVTEGARIHLVGDVKSRHDPKLQVSAEYLASLLSLATKLEITASQYEEINDPGRHVLRWHADKAHSLLKNFTGQQA